MVLGVACLRALCFSFLFFSEAESYLKLFSSTSVSLVLDFNIFLNHNYSYLAELQCTMLDDVAR